VLEKASYRLLYYFGNDSKKHGKFMTYLFPRFIKFFITRIIHRENVPASLNQEENASRAIE
jgi:hypothetical protein